MHIAAFCQHLQALCRTGWWMLTHCMHFVLQGMEQTSYVVDDFVREWKKVWEAVACLPNFDSDIKGRLLVDLANEPDSQWQVSQPKGACWCTCLHVGGAGDSRKN